MHRFVFKLDEQIIYNRLKLYINEHVLVEQALASKPKHHERKSTVVFVDLTDSK